MNDTEKAAWKGKLEKIGAVLKEPWHSQVVHKALAGAEVLDLAGIKDERRAELLTAWMATPASLGANASAFGQALGRETGKEKMTRTFGGF